MTKPLERLPGDLGRDLDIGIPPAETQQVNVVLSEPITDALKAHVESELEETNERLSTIRKIQELILGEDVEGL